jgi:hypothetical protein
VALLRVRRADTVATSANGGSNLQLPGGALRQSGERTPSFVSRFGKLFGEFVSQNTPVQADSWRLMLDPEVIHPSGPKKGPVSDRPPFRFYWVGPVRLCGPHLRTPARVKGIKPLYLPFHVAATVGVGARKCGCGSSALLVAGGEQEEFRPFFALKEAEALRYFPTSGFVQRQQSRLGINKAQGNTTVKNDARKWPVSPLSPNAAGAERIAIAILSSGRNASTGSLASQANSIFNFGDQP